MGHWTGICLKIFLSTKIIVKGKENIIKNEKFFIAASHQSMFETFYFQTIFNSPVFILKNGGETLTGSSGNDTITGGTGNDQIYSGDGADLIDGGDGNDQINGLPTTGGAYV